jgi:glycine/D-amino acid oxidase-like deaminating enzyme
VVPRAALKRRFDISRSSALFSFDNLTVNPRAMTATLLKRAEQFGLRLYAPVDVTEIDAKKTRIIVLTREGHRIRCRWLVLATGYELPKIVPTKGHKIGSTWAFATRPQPRRLWPEECLIWEASDPYLYLRTTEDGRVICGGEDEEFSNPEHRDGLIPRKITILQRKLGYQ